MHTKLMKYSFTVERSIRTFQSFVFSVETISMYFWSKIIFIAFLVLPIIAESERHPPNMPNVNVFSATDYYNVSDKPVLANGHVGYVPYSDSIYLNGVYNGLKGSSHRARIPNYANIFLEGCGPAGRSDFNCTYALDVERAVFETEASLEDGDIHVKQTQFAHRYYDRVIVNTIQLKRNSVNASGELCI